VARRLTCRNGVCWCWCWWTKIVSNWTLGSGGPGTPDNADIPQNSIGWVDFGTQSLDGIGGLGSDPSIIRARAEA